MPEPVEGRSAFFHLVISTSSITGGRVCRDPATAGELVELDHGPLAEAETDAKRSPGRLARHYAPAAPVRLNVETPAPGEAFLAFGPADPGPRTSRGPGARSWW